MTSATLQPLAVGADRLISTEPRWDVTESVLYETRDRIAFVTLNRPDSKNAIDPAMHDLLCRAWADFRDDVERRPRHSHRGRRRVLSPLRPPTFVPAELRRRCAEQGPRHRRPRHRRPHPRHAPDPQARDRGDERVGAGGAGLETRHWLATSAMASDRAMFGSFEARRGYHHGDGGIVRLGEHLRESGSRSQMRADGRADRRASGRSQCNMVSKVVPHERLMEEAELVGTARSCATARSRFARRRRRSSR